MKVNRMTIEQAREALKNAGKHQGGQVSRYSKAVFDRIMELNKVSKRKEDTINMR